MSFNRAVILAMSDSNVNQTRLAKQLHCSQEHVSDLLCNDHLTLKQYFKLKTAIDNIANYRNQSLVRDNLKFERRWEHAEIR